MNESKSIKLAYSFSQAEIVQRLITQALMFPPNEEDQIKNIKITHPTEYNKNNLANQWRAKILSGLMQ